MPMPPLAQEKAKQKKSKGGLVSGFLPSYSCRYLIRACGPSSSWIATAAPRVVSAAPLLVSAYMRLYMPHAGSPSLLCSPHLNSNPVHTQVTCRCSTRSFATSTRCSYLPTFLPSYR